MSIPGHLDVEQSLDEAHVSESLSNPDPILAIDLQVAHRNAWNRRQRDLLAAADVDRDESSAPLTCVPADQQAFAIEQIVPAPPHAARSEVRQGCRGPIFPRAPAQAIGRDQHEKGLTAHEHHIGTSACPGDGIHLPPPCSYG